MSGEQMMLEVNRHLLNFLSGVRMFLDHTETNLKRRYGAGSERYAAFKDATGKAFDTSFAYRFMYQLRNYVQHCGMPLGKMSIHADFDEETRQPISQSIDFLYCRASLLTTYDRWHKKVKADLEALPEYFPIRPGVDEMMGQISDLQKSFVVADVPALLDSLQWLDALMLEATWRGGSPIVARERPSAEDADMDVLESTPFPVEMMELLRRPFHKHFGFGTAQFRVKGYVHGHDCL